MRSQSPDQFLNEQLSESTDELVCSLFTPLSCFEMLDINPEYQKEDPICPKCGSLMTIKRMNKTSFILMCENTESVSILSTLLEFS